MPRRLVLTESERDNLFALPIAIDDLVQYYTLNEHDLSIVRQHRGNENRLGFAILLCYMRYPGIILGVGEKPFDPLLEFVANQLGIDPVYWEYYGKREQTRREHLSELQFIFGFVPFGAHHYRKAIQFLDEIAKGTDKGVTLALALMDYLRSSKILLPNINTIERICASSITRSSRVIYELLTETLSDQQKDQLDSLLNLHYGSSSSTLLWLRESPAANNIKHILEHIERLNIIKDLCLPPDLEKRVHQNRLLKIAREGGQMTAQHLNDFEVTRRYATIVAVLLEAKATLIDEIVELHDKIMGSMFNTAKNAHEKDFQRSGKAINDKVRLYWRIGNVLLEGVKVA